MKLQHITNLIEITETNIIQVREIVVSKTGRRSFHRHAIAEHCKNEHELAHAIRDALPIIPLHDFSSMAEDEEQSFPDFIRVQVATGIVRVNDVVYYWVGVGKVGAETQNPRLIYPGADYSNEPEKVKIVCQIIHTPDRIKAYRERVQAEEMAAADAMRAKQATEGPPTP